MNELKQAVVWKDKKMREISFYITDIKNDIQEIEEILRELHHDD